MRGQGGDGKFFQFYGYYIIGILKAKKVFSV